MSQHITVPSAANKASSVGGGVGIFGSWKIRRSRMVAAVCDPVKRRRGIGAIAVLTWGGLSSIAAIGLPLRKFLCRSAISGYKTRLW